LDYIETRNVGMVKPNEKAKGELPWNEWNGIHSLIPLSRQLIKKGSSVTRAERR